MHEPTRHGLLFWLILILAAGVRFYGIQESSFWLDEFCSVECATGRGLEHVALPRDQFLVNPPQLTTLKGAPPWWHIWTSLRLDNHPPLYFLLLRGWREMVGESDVMSRVLSVVISLAGICFFYDAVKVGMGRTAGLWAALLAAVAMSQIHFAQETRGYGLVGTLGMGACSALMRLEVLGISRRRWAGLFAAALGMLLTHYFAVAGLAALGIYAAIGLRGEKRRAALWALGTAAAVLAVAWGPWLIQQRESFAVNNAWQGDFSAAGHGPRMLKRAVILPMRWCEGAVVKRWPWAAYAGGAGFLLAVVGFRGQRRLWAMWMIFPVLLVMGVDAVCGTRVLDEVRYTLVGSWGLLALVSCLGEAKSSRPDPPPAYQGRGEEGKVGTLDYESAVGKTSRPRMRIVGHVVAGTVALLCVVSIPHSYEVSRQWAQYGEFLGANAKAEDTVVFASAGRDGWYPGAMYLGISYYSGPLASPVVLLTKSPSDEMLEQLRKSRRVWLVAGSDLPAQAILPGFAAVGDSSPFPEVGGRVWELQPK